MQFEFSSNHKMADFDKIDIENKVYLGFASQPSRNIFSQKFQNTPHNSTTQTLRSNFELLTVPAPDRTTLVMHLVDGLVTLDIATAAFIIAHSGQDLDSKQWEYLTHYIDEIEKGITRPPFLKSLYAFFYCSGTIAERYYPLVQQSREKNVYQLEMYWNALSAVLADGKIDSFDAPCRFMDLIPVRVSVLAQADEVANEASRYFMQDYPRAETFELELPLKPEKQTGSTRFARVNLLALSDARTSLLKFFTRNPMTYTDGKERVFQCMYLHKSDLRGRLSEHRISVPPDEDYHLRGLTAILDEIEDETRRRKGLAERPRDNPREHFDYNDPWYDERHAQTSIIDTPKSGSSLEKQDILEALWYYAAPLRNVKPEYVTSSVFIPLWTPDRFKKIVETNSESWKRTQPDESALKWFFPFVANIFSPKAQPRQKNASSILMSYEYQGETRMSLAPDFGEFESVAIDVIQQKSIARSIEILNRSRLRLIFHQYEYGLGFFEILIDPEEQSCSVFDTQWLEQCISLTPFSKLLSETLADWKHKFDPKDSDLESVIIDRLELPNKHFVSSTLTRFNYEGGTLNQGRSTGGALQMMVNDENPIYKNLPFDPRIVTENTVLDITSKRHYFCSTSSLLNYDDVATQSEHIQAHEASRIVFNMVLAQRFILSRSRLDIVMADQNYHGRKQMSMLTWIGKTVFRVPRFFRNPQSSSGVSIFDEEIDISKLRTDIQHMTTSSWFHVVSNKKAIQEIFYKIRSAMDIDQFYREVQDRCVELDEFIMKKESSKQSRIFGFFAYIMSPLSLIAGFAGGIEFNTWPASERGNIFPILSWFFPALKNYQGGVWPVLGFYSLLLLLLVGIALLLNKWLSLKE